MAHFNIRQPIWSSMAVGLRDDQITEHNTVDIDYVNKTGKRQYPNTFKVTGEIAKRYPVQTVRNNVKLRVVPISALEKA